MHISKDWLQEFVKLPASLTSEKIARELTMKTVEVEGVENPGEGLQGIVVGHVVTVEKHPNADKLQVCQVDIGRETLQVVCGGSNVRAGMKVAFGKIGANVRWHGEGEPIELIKTTIRGVESSGMICASDEVSLLEQFPKKEEKEIMDVSHLRAKPGTLLAEALSLHDVVFHIDNKSLSNRPDLWGHYGIARELSAMFRLPLKAYPVSAIPKGKGTPIKVVVKEKKLCPRFMAVAISGVKIGSSPVWMQARLTAAGVRPINTIVDITNYVMLELGQPMHAYDAEQVVGNTIIVRRAETGEKFITLDGKEHIVHEDMLMIADTEKALGVAGVMGGMGSGIKDTTSTIIFEAATFDAKNIRQTSTTLGMRTEASARFEKSLDPMLPEYALQRAVALTRELCPDARVMSPVVDVANFSLTQRPISVPLDFINKKIGMDIKKTEVIDILKHLGFGVKEKKGVLILVTPSWRATKDIAIPEDIVEEIVRLIGYDQVPSVLPLFPATPAPENKQKTLERRVRRIAAYECGFTEVYNYSFESAVWLERLGIGTAEHLRLDNPVAKDRPFIRRSLFPNLLENIEQNIHAVPSVRLFEIGMTYHGEAPGEPTQLGGTDRLPKQDVMLGMAYAEKGMATPFYELAQSLERIMRRLGITYELKKETTADLLFHPGRYARIVANGKNVGSIGELHPGVQRQAGIGERTALVEINLTALVSIAQDNAGYESIPLYPDVERDIAFVVPREQTHQEIATVLMSLDPLIHAVTLFDVFSGTQIGDGKKSMAYHIIYRSREKTLESKEVDLVHERVIRTVKEKFGADVR